MDMEKLMYKKVIDHYYFIKYLWLFWWKGMAFSDAKERAKFLAYNW